MGGGVAMQVAIRHPEKVRKVVSISAVFWHDGWVKEAVENFPRLTADVLKGLPIETEYKKLSRTPDRFEEFVPRAISMDVRPSAATKLRHALPSGCKCLMAQRELRSSLQSIIGAMVQPRRTHAPAMSTNNPQVITLDVINA